MEVIKAVNKTKENGENIYKILNAWIRNCRSILAFMKKEIKDTKRYTIWVVFNSIFMDNKGPSHTLKGCTFFVINFAKKFIIQIIWNAIRYNWDLSSATNYDKLLVLFFLKIFPKRRPFSLFFWFAPDDNNKTTRI